LKRTVVVPTLDTPFPEGKSAVWCSSFQLAWQALERDITKGPAVVRNAESVTKRLNSARRWETDLDAADYFIATGPGTETIEQIQRELPRRFPGVDAPRMEAPVSGSFVAFAFLKAGVRYTSEFADNPKAFEFVDSANQHTNVSSFGLLPDGLETGRDTPLARRQVALLSYSKRQFAVDLCRDSKPYQIVLAMLERKGTLAEVLADEAAQRRLHPVDDSYTLDEDHLLVPNMSWRIEHHFYELEGPDKELVGGAQPGAFIASAVEELEFRLDRRGAKVVSGAYPVVLDGGPKYLYFNKPFLIYLKKRGAERPFFAVWVDNAELLQTRYADNSTSEPR
jgi:hypothetical protein